uniref:MADF domain-containing protein n=1 Tax=Romanomermis culicivorax TaxID=13658 RepID=A0A915JZZ8_ROMCU
MIQPSLCCRMHHAILEFTSQNALPRHYILPTENGSFRSVSQEAEFLGIQEGQADSFVVKLKNEYERLKTKVPQKKSNSREEAQRIVSGMMGYFFLIVLYCITMRLLETCSLQMLTAGSSKHKVCNDPNKLSSGLSGGVRSMNCHPIRQLARCQIAGCRTLNAGN